jgi:hypothetical protein
MNVMVTNASHAMPTQRPYHVVNEEPHHTRFIIPAGTCIARTQRPTYDAQFYWMDVVVSDRTAVFTLPELDARIEPGQWVWPASYYVFRLPLAARPYTYILVQQHLVVVTHA